MGRYQSKFELLINASAGGAKRVLSNLQNDMRKAGGSGRRAASIMESGWAKAGLAIAGVTAGAFALKKALDFAAEGEKIRNIAVAFEQLNENATATQRALSSALRGTVDITSLQTFANQLSTMGIAAEEMGVLADSAFKIAATQGRKTIDVMRTLATAIGTGRLATAAQFGIVVDAKEAQADYAAELGVVADSLDATAKRQALVNALLEEAEKKFGDIDTKNLSTRVQEEQARLEDVWSDITEAAGDAGIATIGFFDRASDSAVTLAAAVTGTGTAYVETTNVLPEFVRQNQEAAAAAAQLEAQERQLAHVEAARAQSLAIIIEATGRQVPKLLEEAKLLDEIRKTWVPINDLMEANVSTLEKRKAKIDALLPSIEAEIQRLGETGDEARALIRWRDLELAKLKDLIPLRRQAAQTEEAQTAAQQALNQAVRGFIDVGLPAELKKTIKGFNEGAVSAIELFAVMKSGAEQTGLTGLAANLSAGLDTLTVAREKMRKEAEKRAQRDSGAASAMLPDPETIGREAARLERELATAQGTIEQVTIAAQISRNEILEEFAMGRIDAVKREHELELLEINTQHALKKAQEEGFNQEMALIAKEQRRLDKEQADADRAALDEKNRIFREQQEKFRDNANAINAQIEATRSSLDAMAASGVGFAETFGQAMNEARTVTDAFNQAVVFGFDSAKRAVPGAIAASGRITGAFIGNTRAQALVQGGFEAAAAIASFATGNFVGGAQHALASTLFFAVAGKGKRGGSGAGTGAQSSQQTAATQPAQLAGGGGSTSTTTVINLNGFLGTKQELGTKITDAQNSIAGLGPVIDPRMFGSQQQGF